MPNHDIHKKRFIWPSHINIMTIVLVVIGIVIGLFITAQWRTEPSRITDPVFNYSSLEKTKEKLEDDQKQYKTDIKKLNDKANEAQKTLKLYAQSEEKVNEVEEYEKKIGLTEYKGSGIIVTLDDSKDINSNQSSISHAADLRDIVNLLWGIGAKAISINNERIVFSTSIDCIVNTILINSTKTTPPFEIKVIGDSEYLYYILTNPNYLKDIHKRVNEEGLVFNVDKNQDILVPAFSGGVKLDYAKLK